MLMWEIDEDTLDKDIFLICIKKSYKTSNEHGKLVERHQCWTETGALLLGCYSELFHFFSYFSDTCECDYIYIFFDVSVS